MKSLIISKDNKGFTRTLNLVHGFTLIEIAIVLAIIAGLFAIAAFVDGNMYQRNLLASEQETLVSILQKARSQSMNNVDTNAHGVHIDTEDYVLFLGQNYVPNDTNNEKIAKNDKISVSNLNNIVFAQLSGEPNKTGKIILDGGTQQKFITIKTGGLINW